MTADAPGRVSSIAGIGRPSTARRCSSNWFGNWVIIVTMPGVVRARRQFGEDRLVAFDEELHAEDAVAAERLDHLARLAPGGKQGAVGDARGLPALAIVAGFLPVADRRAEQDARLASRP